MNNGKSDRDKRLAEALRANLRRRKGQARAQETGGQAAPKDAGTSGTDEGRDEAD